MNILRLSTKFVQLTNKPTTNCISALNSLSSESFCVLSSAEKSTLDQSRCLYPELFSFAKSSVNMKEMTFKHCSFISLLNQENPILLCHMKNRPSSLILSEFEQSFEFEENPKHIETRSKRHRDAKMKRCRRKRGNKINITNN